MKDDIALQPQLIERADWDYRFQLSVTNQSSDRLFIPDLDVTELRFRGVDHPEPLEWYTDELVSATSGGSSIASGASLQHDFDVRPCAVDEGSCPSPSGWEYDRWCVRLNQGEYSLSYELAVNHIYFNPDSHLRFPHLEEMA